MRPAYPSAVPAPTLQAPLRACLGTRIFAAILAAAALSVLITAALIRPDPSGTGTHRQLGLPECGWLAVTGYPCPTCGMTTSFAAATHAQPIASIKAQPFGAAFALATSVFFWAALHVAVFGSMLGRLFERLMVPKVLVPTALFFLAAWAFKAYAMRQG